MNISRFILFFFLLILSKAAIGQSGSSSNNLTRNYNHLSYNLTLRYDHYFENGSYLFWENAAFSTHKPIFPDTYPLNITDYYSWMGYEHNISEKLYLGGSLEYKDVYYDKSFTVRANINHRGKIKSLYFIKGLGFEREKYFDRNGRSSLPIGSWSFMAALGKEFFISENFPGYIFLSYRLMRNFYFNEDNAVFRNRRFNEGGLRLEITQSVSNNLYLGIFSVFQTQYLYLVGMTNQGRYNNIYPTVGLRVNYIFKPEGIKDIIPNLPGR